MVGSKAPLIIGVICGILAIFLVKGHINTIQRQAQEGMKTKEVLAAAVDIPAGTPLTSQMLITREIPVKYVSDGAVVPADKDEIIGQRILTSLKRNDVVLWSNFVEAKTGENLSDIIKVGERALAIPVDVVSSISNFLRPNDHVDFVGTFSDPEKGNTITLTILQNVTVLAVNNVRQTQSGLSKKDMESLESINMITVLVTPEEAQMLILAQGMGSITLVLRNPEDIETDKEFGRVEITDIIKTEKRKEVQIKRNDRITVIKGGQIEHE